MNRQINLVGVLTALLRMAGDTNKERIKRILSTWKKEERDDS